jgi:hypothetical protein
VEVPTLVTHGDADAIVPIEESGQRTHRAVFYGKLVVVNGAPHDLNPPGQEPSHTGGGFRCASICRTPQSPCWCGMDALAGVCVA